MQYGKTWPHYFLYFIISIFVASCSSQRIRNIDNVAIPVQTEAFTLDQVREAIQSAADFLSWRLKFLSPGKVLATYKIRSHTVQVLILYTEDHYSIRYHDSFNLNYDGDEIHESYNLWVGNLNTRIEKELRIFHMYR